MQGSQETVRSFSHSGKLGDIIYSLAGVRALSPADFYINCGEYISTESAQIILPLLNEQPYIREAFIRESEKVGTDLDAFRHNLRGTNLADAHLIPLGLSPDCRDEPWLTVQVATHFEKRPVIFARSDQYRGVEGFWETVYEYFGHQAAFIGTEGEHAVFERQVGRLPHIPTQNLLEVAQIIAGSSLFVGNQSCPLAIAEGLKHTLIQEVYLDIPNCLFFRENCYPILTLPQLFFVLGELRFRSIQAQS